MKSYPTSLVKITVRGIHDNCWSTDKRLTKGIKILDFRIIDDNHLRMLVSVHKDNISILLRLLRETYNLFIVNGVSAYGTNNYIVSFVKNIHEISIPKMIDMYHGYFLGSIYKNGLEEWRFVLPERETRIVLSEIKKIMSQMEVEEDKYEPVEPIDLNDKEIEILRVATEMGYYDNPKGVDLEEIARILHMSPSNVNYHLRNIERKILVSFMKGHGAISRVNE
ncbi:helix-turn-helix domain-containing protein [Metallosphaera javensis (ex Sakai et al. 2022)]|uniref:helix-turn-helix domain-containing protein n=1 Tax=Metallosphaera javensis (ex Sakai et al. 2022) TaxID=2775498 RepID=UPI00258D0668|nr:MAG: hypothetical protein MjAS7_2170 [Metallosphaera javensis (ex Sakai et al. 2022)]